MKHLTLASFVVSLLTFNAHAADISVVRFLVEEFYSSKLNQERLRNPERRDLKIALESAWNHDEPCPQNPTACVDFLCQKMGTFGCDEQSEILRVLRACRGNFGVGCVTVACNKLGTFGCDELREVEQVAGGCRGNYDGKCIEMVCSRLGTFGCDELREIVPIAQECGGTHP